MADNPEKQKEEEIWAVLNDLNSILKNDKPAACDAPAPPAAPAAPPAQPASLPPAPVAAPPPVAAAPPPITTAPLPAAAPPSADILADIPKDQIRRVAILFSAGYRQKKDDLIGFLDQSALTISKKPLYLRKVFFEEIKSDSDAKELVAKILSAHAVVALGILEGFFDGKIRELQEAMNAGGLLFRVISPMDIQKRSMAVDILVDMLLLNPEA